MVAFKIDSRKCIDNINLVTEAEGIDVHDLRTTDYFPKISNFINRKFPSLHKIAVIKKIIRKIFFNHNLIVKIKNYLSLKKYFK